VNLAAWYNDSIPSRFAAEGAQEPFINFVKKTTSKPVVGVGRFTSPDTMVSQLKRGVLDMIGAMRSASRVLVVGAGPAGLEAARALGQRGYEVSLAEARRDLGGRVTREARLPGLAEWARVRDWRLGQINKMGNVAVYRESTMTAQDVLDFAAQHVVLATGCHWRRDGYGRSNGLGIPGFAGNPRVFTPDDIMDGRLPEGRVVVLDDDGFYLASVIAETLRQHGGEVTYLTADDNIAPWSQHTLDYRHIRMRLAELGIEPIVSHDIVGFAGTTLTLEDVWSGHRRELGCRTMRCTRTCCCTSRPGPTPASAPCAASATPKPPA
jgi:dimethylamine/trimethylamine dehydrogenase